MRINILLCDTFPGLLPPSIPSYVSMFTRLFDLIENGIEYHVFEVFKNHYPSALSQNEIYLITGSNSGAYENKIWIKELLKFVGKLHSLRIPLVGVCFGHQVIAQALGGKVMKSEKGWGTGLRIANIIHGDAIPYFSSSSMCLHYNHHDQVVQLPAEAELYATSGFCENEGFMIGKHILTFQGHPEYTSLYNRHLIINHSENEPEEVKVKALESIDQLEDTSLDAAKWILSMIKQRN